MVEALLALLIALTGIPRTADAELSAIAQRRAVEISCEGCFSHAGWIYGRDGHAEIIAMNYGPDPVSTLAAQWQGSPPHWAILTDPKFDRWGCGIHQVGNATWGACIFATGSAPAPAPTPVRVPTAPAPPVTGSEPAPSAPPILIPDTALEAP
jgi:hypothetical protein